jgi:hypothetical protein
MTHQRCARYVFGVVECVFVCVCPGATAQATVCGPQSQGQASSFHNEPWVGGLDALAYLLLHTLPVAPGAS